MAKRIETAKIQSEVGSRYPEPYNLPCRPRVRKRLGDAAGLRLPSGAWSSQRHWHTVTDEFVYVLEGEVVLVTDGGEEVLVAGDAAGFKGGEPNGHHIQNRSASDAVFLEVGTRDSSGACYYCEADMIGPPNDDPAPLIRRDGTPYLNLERRGPLD